MRKSTLLTYFRDSGKRFEIVISVIRDLLFCFLFVNRARDLPPCTTVFYRRIVDDCTAEFSVGNCMLTLGKYFSGLVLLSVKVY